MQYISNYKLSRVPLSSLIKLTCFPNLTILLGLIGVVGLMELVNVGGVAG